MTPAAQAPLGTEGSEGTKDSETATPASWSSRTTRKLDLRYRDRPPATSHRPYFPFVERFALGTLASAGPSLLDVGCANGSFIDYLHRRHPHAAFTGMDALPELVTDAADMIPAARFIVADIEDPASLPREVFPLVTMLTLHSHFDELGGVLDNLMALVEPGGKALVFGLFNPYSADVLVRIQVPGDPNWLPGWNIHSRRSVDDLLTRRGFDARFHDYEPTPEWPPASDDPLRTRRAVLDSQSVLLNGAGLVLPFALLEIRR